MNAHPSKIITDLDGVVAGPKPTSGNYTDCSVNGPLVQRLRELKAQGWVIAFYTSRNVKTHDHNVGKINATTLPDIHAWLKKNDVPFDELYVGKPWAGPEGFYVDDRAVRPSEFLELTVEELRDRAHAEHFDPRFNAWRRHNDQRWSVLDLRKEGVTVAAVSTVVANRENGERTGLLLPADYKFQAGVTEELRRLGARWSRFDASYPVAEAQEVLEEDLKSAGELTYTSILRGVQAPGLLKARHFNRVEVKGQHVFKTATTPAEVRKLELEAAWLLKAGPTVALQPHPIRHGYYVDYEPRGSLAQVLLRQTLSAWDLKSVAEDLSGILDYFSYTAGSQRGTAYDHDELIINKTKTRLKQLQELLLKEFQIQGSYTWHVNEKMMGPLDRVVNWLLDTITPPKSSDYAIWHGDLCPGNILVTSDDFILKLIDPRGSVDGRTGVFYGDKRYDLGKLCHALHCGYDALVEGWYDCSFVRTGANGIDVRLRLWDEDLRPNQRSNIWNQLGISDPVVMAMAALQLITCAPLHRDDPQRVLALVARGLEAARWAGYKY
jgi:capsule biosynthesis phosphatase